MDSGIVDEVKTDWKRGLAVVDLSAMKTMKKTSHSLMKTMILIMLMTIRTLKKRLPGTLSCKRLRNIYCECRIVWF